MRPLLLVFTLAVLTSTTAHAQQVVEAIKQAQNQIIAYLPSPTSVRIAQALKDAANAGVPVYLIAPRQAHLEKRSYLLSVALAAAQTPPAALNYYPATLNAAPLIIIDNRVLYLGPGVQDGIGAVEKSGGNKLTRAVELTTQAMKHAPNVAISQLVKERYGLDR